ncbi:hypothetical protein GCM10020000_53820 [Streptomyces olivoverticillatus]
MKVDGGGTLQTYCIDILTNTVDGAKYKEAGWDESSLHDNKNAGKIRWILQHSYPQVNDLAALGKDSGSRHPRRQHGRGQHPGRHLALLGQRQRRRPRPRGREARRLPLQERPGHRGAQGLADAHPAQPSPASPGRSSAPSRSTPTRAASP